MARLKPDSWSAYSNLGNAFSLLPGRLDDAIAEYRAALEIRPESAAAHNNMGYALSQKPGSLPDAVHAYREALRLNPDSADAHYNLGAALAQMPGQRRAALAEFEAALRLRPSAQVGRTPRSARVPLDPPSCHLLKGRRGRRPRTGGPPHKTLH